MKYKIGDLVTFNRGTWIVSYVSQGAMERRAIGQPIQYVPTEPGYTINAQEDPTLCLFVGEGQVQPHRKEAQ